MFYVPVCMLLKEWLTLRSLGWGAESLLSDNYISTIHAMQIHNLIWLQTFLYQFAYFSCFSSNLSWTREKITEALSIPWQEDCSIWTNWPSCLFCVVKCVKVFCLKFCLFSIGSCSEEARHISTSGAEWAKLLKSCRQHCTSAACQHYWVGGILCWAWATAAGIWVCESRHT